MQMTMQRSTMVAGGLLAAAALAWAATSTNYILDPVVIDSGGGQITSTNYVNQGSIGGTLIASAGGNQAGATSSTNFIHQGSVGETVFFVPTAGVAALTVSTGANNPGNSNEALSTVVPMQQITLRTGPATAVRINSLTLTASGSGNDATHLTGVNCYVDTNGNGVVDTGELTFASQQTFSGDNLTATFTPATFFPMAVNATVNLLIVHTFNASAPNGATFQTRVNVGGIAATDTLSAPIAISGLPVLGGVKTIVSGAGATGSLTLSLGPANPGGSPVAAGTLGAEWLQIRLTASSVENVSVSAVKFTASGTLHDVNDIVSVELWDDATGFTPGVLDSADTSLATGAVYTGNDGTVTVSFSPALTIFASGTETWLVVYNLGSGAAGGATATCSIAAGADITAVGGTSTNTIVPTGAPVGSMRSITFPPPTVINVPGTPGSSGGGGCAIAPMGVTPAGHPLAVILPWLALVAVLAFRRRSV